MKYASDLVTQASFAHTRTVDTPLELNVKLSPTYGTPLEDYSYYLEIVDLLVYFTVTRLDIQHAVDIVSQFQAAPRYLDDTLHISLLFLASPLILGGYYDFDRRCCKHKVYY